MLVAARPIAAGAPFVRADLTTARAGEGLPAAALWDRIGTPAPRAFAAGEVITP